MPAMSVTELTSQLDRSGLNVAGSETFEAKFVESPNSSDMSVTPVVHDLASSTSSVGEAATNASRAARSRLVYKTPPRVKRVSPTAAPGHFTVTPLSARGKSQLQKVAKSVVQVRFEPMCIAHRCMINSHAQ
jgi:hypothetical protein